MEFNPKHYCETIVWRPHCGEGVKGESTRRKSDGPPNQPMRMTLMIEYVVWNKLMQQWRSHVDAKPVPHELMKEIVALIKTRASEIQAE